MSEVVKALVAADIVGLSQPLHQLAANLLVLLDLENSLTELFIEVLDHSDLVTRLATLKHLIEPLLR